jgi:hypothetical protein
MMCGESMFVLDAVPPNVVLVVDKSGSMVREQWDADQDESTPEITRWKSLHTVVSFIVETFETEINFGAVLFPSLDAEAIYAPPACLMATDPEVPVAPMNAQAVLSMLPGANEGTSTIQGGTPAAQGVRVAVEHLRTLDASVDRFIILVTDGAANCSADYESCEGSGCPMFEEYDEDLATVVGSAFADDDIPTFVVGVDIADEIVGTSTSDGVPAVNTFEKLNEVAQAGGRARAGDEAFFNSLNEADLQSALQEIAGQVVSCTIPLDPQPTHPGFVEIEIDGNPVPRASDCTSEDGWVFVNPSGPYDAIELCNAACDMLADHGQLDALYGCPPVG